MSKSIEDLVREYRDSAVAHGEATEVGDHKKANKHHDRLIRALHALRAEGADGDTALLGLLADDNSSVRGWAATHCLRIDEAQARRTLEALSTEPGIIGFDAQMVLSEWKNGTLRLP